MKESVALMFHLLDFNAPPETGAALTLESHARPSLPDELRVSIERNATLRHLAYQLNFCDLKIYMLAKQMFETQLSFFPNVVSESEAVLRARQPPKNLVNFRGLGRKLGI